MMFLHEGLYDPHVVIIDRENGYGSRAQEAPGGGGFAAAITHQVKELRENGL
jgi:hypothetical protein